MSKANNIFDMFDDIIKTFNEFNEIKKNAIKDYVGEGIHNEVTFKYGTKLEPEDKKKIIIDKLNKWTKLARIFGTNTVIKFVFAENEIFYFTWDEDLKSFVTEDPNGDRFLYNLKDETLNKIVDAEEGLKKADEEDPNKNEASGVSSEVVDNTVDITKGEGVEKNFNLKDDKNLASNLRNALRESYAEWKNDDQCKEIFCPVAAAENFKKNVIDAAAYVTEFDKDDNPIQIAFNISWLIPDYEFGEDSYYIAIDDIYHNESANLDQFCEIVKEKYNFSLGSWNVKFDDDKNVEEIEFIFTF
jgi:hypothetical protein